MTVIGKTRVLCIGSKVDNLTRIEEAKDIFISILLNLPGHPNSSKESVLDYDLEFKYIYLSI